MRIDRFVRRLPPEPEAASADRDRADANRRVRAVVARLAQARPDVLRVRDLRRETAGGLRRDHYVFDHGGREGVRGVLLAPAAERGPWPAVLVCPGRNATLEGVTGLTPPDHPDRDVAVRLAGAGFLTLTLDYGLEEGSGDPRLGARDPADVLDGAFRLAGGSLLGALAEDALAALGWLAACPDVAPDRIGVFGHSLGAAVALHAALLRASLPGGEAPPVCAASHLGDYATMIGSSLAWNQYAALPSILRHADLCDLYSALAPAPLQVQYGLADPRVDRHEADRAAERIRKAYAETGAAGAAETRALPMGHGTGVAEAVDFFRRALAVRETAGPDVPAAVVGFDPGDRLRITDLVDDALASGRLTLGAQGARLEDLAGRWLGRGAAAVSSGSSALEIALRIVGVEGRTVLVPVNTFFATAACALRAGAWVDFVDTEPDGLGIDPGALRAALDAHEAAGRTVAAVVPVHIAGIVSPALEEVLAECGRRGVAVVEDAAHALGSTWRDRPAGTFGRLAAFSLYPTKVITSGEGGLVAAGPDDLDRVRSLRDHGKRSFHENVHVAAGGNWRMSELHAAVGVTHLARLAEVTAERRRLAEWYDDHLGAVPGLGRHTVPGGCVSNHYKYVAYLPEGADRAAVRARLRAAGVSLAGEVYDTPLHRQPYFAESFAGRRFPGAESFTERHVCLPLFPGMTRRQQERVLTALREALS
ncbi:DegT/DnrJ/EryC1/StrS aminotransferase family protein [Streptosporangium sandarakinum]|uniref:DegT/DnrJ/EryC1/StrS aminotransferase family protein n=1 Tax=Streptosporangium sandarakinum TaxID=1260955 RepID=UPI0034268900